jgi:hypothetical protein
MIATVITLKIGVEGPRGQGFEDTGAKSRAQGARKEKLVVGV